MSDPVPLAGVIGHPAGHSLSPRLHAHWLSRYDLRGHYVPVEVSRDDLRRVLAVMPAMGFAGCNVTIPHKEAAIELADSVTERAAAIGAANTLTFRADGAMEADNTDGAGFLANLRQTAPGWQPGGGPAVIFGAGGAARAVIQALLDAGVPRIRLTNRTGARAHALQQEFGARVEVHDWADAREILDGAATAVNASSLGMTGHSPFDVPLDLMPSGAVAADLVYTPLRTRFLADAEARGARIVDGLGMLLHQAVPGFERWFGTRPEVDQAARDAVLAR